MSKNQITVPITIDHIARIEGKAGIEVLLENDNLKEIKVNVFEGPRFFEAITIGKPVEEAVAIFPRVCSFCAAAHKITALQAAENALDIKPSKQTELLRELMYLGDQIESHTLHLFLLALPDFLGYLDAFSMSNKYPIEVKSALKLKDIGAKIQILLGSRFMHQENAIIGGFGKIPTKNSLHEIKEELISLKEESEIALNLFLKQEIWPEVASKRTHLALQPKGKTYSILGENISTSDGDTFPASEYRNHIKEEVVSHSFAKHSTYKGKPFMTSALSRITLFNNLLTGRGKDFFEQTKDLLDSANPLANNLAQAIELVYFIDYATELTDVLVENLKDEKPKKYKIKEAGHGVSVSEAPRGLLAYTIDVNKQGLIEKADIITPTAMFLPQVEVDLRQETNALLEQGIKDSKIISQKLETIVRAYDPCVSCSVHVTEVKK
ncbi:MAG TPA: Ni/Fe hydrogenase subunit alpha [Candidatus Bathyarchaeia archaeon]|nr:Ni/Fe hydrogenase subunit alpha [Candidatus Bathyarchaeia archaeon]